MNLTENDIGETGNTVGMKIGFTGTQIGMTKEQMEIVSKIVIHLNPSEAHVGDCIGADTDFYKIIRSLCPLCVIHGHIPIYDNKRSKLKYDVEYEPKP